MNRYSLTGVADDALLCNLRALVAQDRTTTAALLAHISEVDERRLYRPAAYPSMYADCLGEMRMSESVAYRRIRVARAARAYPRILPAIESGELNVSTVFLLESFLTPVNADEFLSAAAGRSKREVERLIAERFPQPDLPPRLTPISPTEIHGTFCLPVPGHAEVTLGLPAPGQAAHACSTGASPAQPAPAAPEQPHPRVASLSPERIGVQFTASRHAHDQLRYAQALLGHSVPSGDIAQVFERALDALVEKLERDKFAKSSRTGKHRGSHDPRHVPASVRRAVLERDQGRCTFVAANRQRCEARTRLEFDHVTPVARGGQATTANIRLRCRAHNPYEAERAFGAGFMRGERDQARRRAVQPERHAQSRARSEAASQSMVSAAP